MASDEDHTQFLDLATGSSLRHVPQPAPAARLVVMEGSELEGEDELQEIVLEPGQDYVVGRGETCTVPINSRKLSRQHLRLYPGDDQWGVEDLNSTNGIYVNGQRVNDSWLTPGDEVYLGGIQLRYVLEGGAGSEATGGWRDAAPDDDDDNERTMYFGASIGEAQVASSAILEAREAVEEDVTEDLTEQVVPTVQREALPEPGRWSKRFRQAVKIMAFLAILLGLAVSAIAYYPVYAKNSAIEAIVKRLEGPLRSLADNAYRSAGSLSPEVSERQLAQLARLGELVSPTLLRFPDDVRLIDLDARLRFLVFERGFSPALAGGDLDAADGRLEQAQQVQAARRANATTEVAKEAEGLRQVDDLLALAGLVLELRRFSLSYPEPDAAAPPPATLMAEMSQRTETFARLRRSNDSPLKVWYRLFLKSVEKAESVDVEKLNRWKGVLRDS
ncbi:MAG: FHA domain-containing protein [Alphaproteobacteria bacterium]|nr:FHA domain-containing protein [Alphaproteobacteria bacterium]HJP23106.1 FHA domain-containing protein [Alphaproteobacteria bacterium]